ncbi:Helicase conserved C-terminal domain containing protein [Coccidioides posadasii C735 delta SOWgp]|uniref:RNA helicase n=1 Tax=Coccidioides posadasii (strain C735) TaxID=222929 RepID=C5PI30_COCP7|nr:Helicase conserved C-terminal domain containing protein [Coccidioides posadasii C735 delta SOWgp]EER24183.1 Helicase conserved C-terminal domain containing protein [Coccidioides posadasii C735 delta SOWgp]|eukprot:XP_003066328.1 Helicase conserved C-terminal domain containing protein [Coccidioides posadasii C735 delta SOWgp]
MLMQPWRGSQTPCLICLFRQSVVPRQFTRSLSTSRPLERGKPKSSKSKLAWKQTSLRLPQEQKKRNARNNAVRRDQFTVVLERILQDLERKVKSNEGKSTWREFQDVVTAACTQSGNQSPNLALSQRLHEAFIRAGEAKLASVLEEEYRNYKYDIKFSSRIKEQKALADYRFPAEWYPAARALQRTIHLHVGPTNSGKTYHALKRLEEAKSGFYAGPLRLLAHEVYSRFNAKGISCGLITGDEVKVPEGTPPTLYSNTVEMAPLGLEVDVAVIDEIQMIGDRQRGWAWTRALLGAPAKEVHLCGEERVVPLIRELAALTGDKLEIHNYKRLNPLIPMTKSLKGNLQKLQKGDCVVAFSRLGIHALKQEIEKATGRRAAIVYGGLPAEIRSQQADLFNNPDNDYDFLVASDAIGMGLNLSCKRIIFESVIKRSPVGLERLSVSQVKQIGGRAGRYRSVADAMDKSKPSKRSEEDQNVGFVTCLEDVDLPHIQKCLRAEAEPINAAGILPQDSMITAFTDHFPSDTPFRYLLQRLWNVSQTHPRFFMCDLHSSDVQEILDDVPGLSVTDKLVFLSAPTSTADPTSALTLKAFATCVAQHKSGALLDIPELHLEILDVPVSGNKNYLRSLESLHRSLVLYLWLSFRIGGIFTDRTLATHVKELVEMKMDRALTEFSANSKLTKSAILRKQAALLKKGLLEEAEEIQEVDFDPSRDVEIQPQKVGVAA